MRSRRPPSHLWSILVIVAMLWSQAVYAFHGGCVAPPFAAGTAPAAPVASGHASTASSAQDHHCDGGTSRGQDPACEFHCADPAGASDIARLAPLHAVLPNVVPLYERVVGPTVAAFTAPRNYEAPRVRLRGPTGHPAPLLLI